MAALGQEPTFALTLAPGPLYPERRHSTKPRLCRQGVTCWRSRPVRPCRLETSVAWKAMSA